MIDGVVLIGKDGEVKVVVILDLGCVEFDILQYLAQNIRQPRLGDSVRAATNLLDLIYYTHIKQR